MLLSACERALVRVGITRFGAERVLVGCSGGADSMALVRVAERLLGADRVVVGHVDHGQHAGSAAIAEALERFMRGQGLLFLRERVAPASGSEADLRRARYAALERMRTRAEADRLLVAHSRDDQAETVLMGLVRDGGLHGLSGMPDRRDRLLRPLLEVPRAELRAYVTAKGWPIFEDPSNLEPSFLRNRVRKELLPLLERRYGRGVTARLAELASRTEPSPRPPPPPVPPPPRVSSPLSEWTLSVKRAPWPSEEDSPRTPPERALFDAGGLISYGIRSPRPGDRVRPYGLGGSRKVADVLAEAGIPAPRRGYWPLVVDAEDRVVWIPRVIRSEHAPVTSQTREVWIFSAPDRGR